MDNKFNKQLQNSIKNRRLYIGGSMALDPDFDIKNYISDIQKQVQLEKINFNSKTSLPPIKISPSGLITEKINSNFNTINYDKDTNRSRKRNKFNVKSLTDGNKPLITLNNLLSLSKDNIFNKNISKLKRTNTIDTDLNDLNIQKKLFEANNAIQVTKNKIEKIIKKNRESTKSYNSIFQNRSNDMFITSEPRFNIIKAIKEIKKREKYSSQINIIGDNNNLKSNYKTREDYDNLYNNSDNNPNNDINENVIAFDRKHENVVFEPVKLLNDMKVQKQLKINPIEKSLNNFNLQNKQLTINSILLKLMNLETKKLYKNYNVHLNKISNNKKTLERNETNFEEYKEIQKKACKQLDTLAIKIQKKNKELISENLNCKSDIKLIQDEMRKILHQIEHLRIYGYFVNEVLGGDTTRFEKKIFPEQKYDDEIDIEKLSKTVINRYKCFYDDSHLEKFEIENTFIDEPEKMWYKFKEMEGIMVRDLYEKENIKVDIKKIKEENIINLKDLRQKHESLQREYENLNENYNYELSNFNEIEKRYNYQKSEFDDIIKDFYIYVKNIFNKENIINDNNQIYNTLDPSDCIKEIYEIICDKELYINNLIKILKKYENKEPIIFETILNKRKKQIRNLKQLNILEKKMNDKFKFVNNFENGKLKFVINSRKTEAPYHKPKKIVKEKVDEKVIEEIENEELLRYEEEK